MEDRKQLFQTFSDTRLIEIVKNAKQFGYDEEIRNTALQVLKERDISEEDLQLTGNLTNYKFDYTHEIYRSYLLNSRIAFFAYLVCIIIKGIVLFHLMGVQEPGIFFIVAYWIFLVLFLGTLIKSFFDHINFYKSIGKTLGTGDQIIYFVLGMPFYIFMFFFYKNRMKEEMQMIK